MKRNIYLVLLLAFLGKTVAAQSEDFSKLRRMFDYDHNRPLDVKEVGIENRDAIQVHDISYASPKGGRVSAYLVVPPGKRKFAAGEIWKPETEAEAKKRAERLIAFGLLQWRGSEIETTELGRDVVSFDQRRSAR